MFEIFMLLKKMKLNTTIITHFTEGMIYAWVNPEDIRQKIFGVQK